MNFLFNVKKQLLYIIIILITKTKKNKKIKWIKKRRFFYPQTYTKTKEHRNLLQLFIIFLFMN